MLEITSPDRIKLSGGIRNKIFADDHMAYEPKWTMLLAVLLMSFAYHLHIISRLLRAWRDIGTGFSSVRLCFCLSVNICDHPSVDPSV